jgi:hypothetical protein
MQFGINITKCEYYCCDLDSPTLNTVCCFPSEGFHMDYTWIASIVIPVFLFVLMIISFSFSLIWFNRNRSNFLIS